MDLRKKLMITFCIAVLVGLGYTGAVYSAKQEILLAMEKTAGDTAALNTAVRNLSMLLWSGIIMLLVVLVSGLPVIHAIVRPLRKIGEEVQDSSLQVAAASSQLSSASQSLSQGASEEASSLEEISASINEVSSMIRNDADNLQQADALARDSEGSTKKADEGMERLTAAMAEISTASEDTQKIVKTIDEIAFQTNLLALNAAVEAARAGEAGAGFAVVADEVRSLAMRAAEAARSTSQLIEGTIQKVTDGNLLVSEVSKSFQEAARNSEQIGTLVGEIATSAQEQAQAVGQVSQAMAQIEIVTQNQNASAEEVASASEELNTQAEVMKGVVGRLTSLVEGRARIDAKEACREPTVKPAPRLVTREKNEPAEKQAPKSLPQPAAKEKSGKNPQEVIPFDEDAFEDF